MIALLRPCIQRGPHAPSMAWRSRIVVCVVLLFGLATVGAMPAQAEGLFPLGD